MKALIVVFILVAGAVWAVIHFSGMTSYDPAQQLAEMKANVQPGMNWSAVCDIREPKRMAALVDDPESMTGQGQEFKFVRADVEPAIQNGDFSAGFVFFYNFGEPGGIEVFFDGSGNVTAVQDMVTMGTLLN